MKGLTTPLLVAGAALLTGCARRAAAPPPMPRPPAERPGPGTDPTRPQQPPHPLDRRGSFVFHQVPLNQVISRVAQRTGVGISVSPTIPVAEWGRHKVTLRMADVTVRAFLDWLARPLRAEYAVEADGSAWLTRGDDLLRSEPLVTVSYRVPTHYRAIRPRRGAFDYRWEQKQILATVREGLRSLERRRPGCRLAFHGGADVLTARLTPRGHVRLRQILLAMRHGTEEPPVPRPAAQELKARLAAKIRCEWPPGPVDSILLRVAERAELNLGWDTRRLGQAVVLVPKGTHTVRHVLDSIARQSRVGRARVEPGHGIWLYLDGQDVPYPASSATPWDRATVRAYTVRGLLATRSPKSILAAVRARVDPGQWDTGLPAASLFLPTGRLIVLHDQHGHGRVRGVLDALGRAPVGPPPKAREPSPAAPQGTGR